MEKQWHEVRLDHDEGDAGFAKAAPSILEALQLIERTQVYREACLLGDRLAQYAAIPDTVMSAVEKQAVLDALEPQRAAMAPFLKTIRTTFADGCDASSSGALTEDAASVVQREDGLVAPAALFSNATDDVDGVGSASLLAVDHPCADYGLFCAVFDRLSTLVASGTWFTAAEPRLKILQGRYALHRTFNGEREDGGDAAANAAPMGGPDLRRAAKVDVRRLETSVSASTVVRLLSELLATDPRLPVVVRPRRAAHGEHSTGETDSGDETTHDHEEAPPEDATRTLEDLLEDFYGRDLDASGLLDSGRRTPERRRQLRDALSVESLCLRPLDGTAQDGLRWRHGRHGGSSRGSGSGGGAAPAAAFTPSTTATTTSPSTGAVFSALAISGQEAKVSPTPTEAATAVDTAPAPFALPADVRPHSDRQERAADLLRHVLCIDGSGNDGAMLRRLVVPALRKCMSWGSDMNRLELELTLTGRDPDELHRLAVWCTRSGLMDVCRHTGESLVQFALHITQQAYCDPSSGGSPHSAHAHPAASQASSSTSPSSTDAESAGAPMGFRGVLDNLFRPLWRALVAPWTPNTPVTEETSAVLALLQRVTCISVSLDAVSDAVVQAMPVEAALPEDAYPVTGPPPPDALYLFHLWREVQLLNAFASAHRLPCHAAAAAASHATSVDSGDPATAPSTRCPALGTLFACGPLRLRLHCVGNTQRTSINESILGLLLCDHVVNPAHAMEWGPLTYLYYLVQRHVQISPTRNRFSPAVVRQTLGNSLAYAMRVGLHASIVTVDPLLFSTSNDALVEELDSATQYFDLSPADAAELCLRGVEASAAYAPLTLRRALGDAWPRATARDNVFRVTQVPSLRIHFRDACLAHELDLLCRCALPCTVVRGMTRSAAWLASRPLAATEAPLPAPARVRAARARVFGWLGLADPLPSAELDGTVPAEPWRAEGGVEKGFWYPRIVITGPSSGSTGGMTRAAARTLVHIANRRTAYQQFGAKSEAVAAPADAARASSAGRGGLSAPDVSSYLPPARAATSRPTSSASAPPSTLVAAQTLVMTGGVMHTTEFAAFAHALPSWDAFQRDVRTLRAAASHPAIQRLAQKRLGMLENKYHLHVALTNDDQVGFSYQLAQPSSVETRDGEQGGGGDADRAPIHRVTPGRLQKNDVYNCVKVDVHVHMAGGITAPTLLRFMKQKLSEHGDDIVGLSPASGAALTLREVFSEALAEPGAAAAQRSAVPLTSRAKADNNDNNRARVTQEVTVREETARHTGYVRLENLTIANLQVHAGKATFNRFDEFNSRYSPMGVASLRTLFLKTDNFMGGRYFAELIHHTFAKQQAEGNVFSENRLSIYGRSRDEWDRLARWFVQHGMSHATNRWMIQVPRLFHLYRRTGQLKNFAEMLENIFAPLWEATLEPAKHPFLNAFLAHVSGFDSVDNESDREPDQRIDTRPVDWTRAENPPFAYYMYYMWANLTTLNKLRAARGLATFDFRPHAGESGDPDHMADAFFLADGIGHGIQLRHRPVLEYLYYLTQIPLGVVPLSNNALFCRYHDNPFPRFLHRGLRVALATDGALMFHHTEQPLIEEYSTAQNVWNLSSADVCEVARHSVLMSGFPRAQKEAWLGTLFDLASVAGNDVAKSCVPVTRIAFRYEVFLEEARYLQRRAESSLLEQAVAPPSAEDLETLETVGLTRTEVLAKRWMGLPVTRADAVKVANEDAPLRKFRVASANL